MIRRPMDQRLPVVRFVCIEVHVYELVDTKGRDPPHYVAGLLENVFGELTHGDSSLADAAVGGDIFPGRPEILAEEQEAGLNHLLRVEMERQCKGPEFVRLETVELA